MATEAELKLFQPSGAIRYRDMIPLALRLCRVPAIAAHLRSRWSMIVCDEFQDTDDGQFRLLTAIRGDARLLLLGDPNQCIYASLPSTRPGVRPERLAAALALPAARQVILPEASHRDPTGVLPAAAAAIRIRDLGHDAVTTAIATGRLQVHSGLSPAHEAATSPPWSTNCGPKATPSGCSAITSTPPPPCPTSSSRPASTTRSSACPRPTPPPSTPSTP